MSDYFSCQVITKQRNKAKIEQFLTFLHLGEQTFAAGADVFDDEQRPRHLGFP
jgi:hypothetical protein